MILQFSLLLCNKPNANSRSTPVIEIAILSYAGKIVKLMVKS